jgi:hypothetical protein
VADFGSPVATGINPNQGLQTLSQILAIKGQQQGLAGQAAEVQQKQQTAGQRANLATFFQSFDPTKHVGADGTVDLDSVLTDPKLRQAAGDQFPEIMQQMIGVKQGQIQAKQQLAGLNDTLRNQFSTTIGSLRTDPDVVADNPNGRKKVQQAIGNFAESGGPDAERVANTYAEVINHIPKGKLTQTLSNFQLQAQSAGAQAQAQAPALADTGATLQNIAPQAAGGPLAGQPPIVKTPGPTQTIPYLGAAAGATSQASALGSGVANADVDRANQVAGLQQQSAAALPLTERIDQLSHDIGSGKVAKMISETGNYLGFASINEARSQLNKDLGQVKALAIQNAGSDSRAATVLEGYPTDTTPESTVHAAMDYIRGAARQNLARGKLLSQYQKADPQGLRGFQAADNMMSGQTNPLMHEYLALKPADQAGFYRRNFSTPQEAQAFKDQVNALKKHSRVLDSQ